MQTGKCFFALLLLAFQSNVFAARFALLVGVSKYAIGGDLNLEGPDQDIPALKLVLMKNQGFKENDITVLRNQEATRQAILARLTELVVKMKAGDYLLFYFGGHGTSAFDENNTPLASFIGPNSGALIPHDLNIASTATIVASLIIGQRDLRPILERLPAQSDALVILDACYSENSVKSTSRPHGKNRGIVLGNLALEKKNATQLSQIASMSTEVDRSYPYRNVVALTASSKDERAEDIAGPKAMVNGRLPTFDGKAHGAFTNSLVMALTGPGDLNHDGKISFQELYDFTRQSVQAHFSQTPQLLMPASGLSADFPALAAAPLQTGGPKPIHVATEPSVVEGPTPERKDQSAKPQCEALPAVELTKLRVRLENVAEDLRANLAGHDEIEIAADRPELIVRFQAAGFDLYDASGTLIRSYPQAESSQMIARVLAQPKLRHFIDFGYSCQTFNVSLRMRPEGQASFSSKERPNVEGSVEKQAYLLLFDVDKSGTISIVYPAKREETGRVSSEKPIFLGRLRPEAPFGSEYLKLFAFAEAPPLDLLGCKPDTKGILNCPDIEPATPRFEALMKFLDSQSGFGAENRLRFTTYE